MNVMTKRGSLDNSVIFEHYCDTKADLQNIPKDQVYLGSIAIVLKGTDDELEVFMADSQKNWISLFNGGGSGGGNITVEALTATENKVYTADTGKAYNPVTVNVEGTSSGAWADVENEFDIEWHDIVTSSDVITMEKYSAPGAGEGRYNANITSFATISKIFNEDSVYFTDVNNYMKNYYFMRVQINGNTYISFPPASNSGISGPDSYTHYISWTGEPVNTTLNINMAASGPYNLTTITSAAIQIDTGSPFQPGENTGVTISIGRVLRKEV